MIVEGHISRDFLSVLREAGTPILWECQSVEDAVKHGYHPNEFREGTETTLASIHVGVDLELFFLDLFKREIDTPMYSIVGRLKQYDLKKLLPLMALCNNKAIREFAANKLSE